ncbi:putative oxidoreductase [Metapseudomonas resinovorans NBRC 106553]|uniref:Putative oxidoreductase n=1 Tax=Metapseudomonas resinovorans NBRC 106553 TaxID=1245471 RepID=S6APE5_METRE|nr:FAD-dependent oxidoreductase [Pseudomonas resinovorans]BAN47518.1 putative oxidoreductase [Pseudomonas resinovorans NBRC 106553]
MTRHPEQALYYDPASVAGKAPPIRDETDILIVGAGPAGLAAALTAAGHGLNVTLVDENPVPLETMGEEVPLHFGGRMGAAVSNRNSVLNTLLEARPEIAEALEAGVDVRLGTAVWGLFPQQPTRAWIAGAVAGLADDENAYLLRFRQVIVAAGRRDMGLAFDGWQRPGVMGISAAHRLATVYGALESRIAVVLGSDTHALATAHALSGKGVRIAAIVEQAAEVSGDAALLGLLVEQGAQVLTGHVIAEAGGDALGVKRVSVVAVDSAGHRVDGAQREIECDSVLLGVAAIPAIELVESAGCSTSFKAERGGHVADTDAALRTSLPYVLVAGDCAGAWSSKSLDEDIARREGRIAAQTALAALGVEIEQDEEAVLPDLPAGDIAARRADWVRASALHAQNEPYICLCEEVTAREIIGQQPPRYLGWPPAVAIPGSYKDSPNPDVTKRLTRACMGPCQGRRCREQVAGLLSLDSGVSVAEIALASFRPPVRPLSLRQAGQIEEVPQMQDRWDAWFDMPSQWTPFWLCAGQQTTARRPQETPGQPHSLHDNEG